MNSGLPEFAVSVALVEDARPVAGGICNPATHEIFLGSIDSGVTYNGQPARPTLQDALILASRSEMKRGQWKRFEHCSFRIRALASIATSWLWSRSGSQRPLSPSPQNTNGTSPHVPLSSSVPVDSSAR
jgi:fructose-1,6-bisphosphatase/inositol monophosphatase family enzyme